MFHGSVLISAYWICMVQTVVMILREVIGHWVKVHHMTQIKTVVVNILWNFPGHVISCVKLLICMLIAASEVAEHVGKWRSSPSHQKLFLPFEPINSGGKLFLLWNYARLAFDLQSKRLNQLRWRSIPGTYNSPSVVTALSCRERRTMFSFHVMT